jgi:hypothetical protein
MCTELKMTMTQKVISKRCSCKAKKSTLRLYSCCGSVNVLCSSCDKSGPRESDLTGKMNKYGRPVYMDEKKGNSKNRTRAIEKWNELIGVGVL